MGKHNLAVKYKNTPKYPAMKAVSHILRVGAWSRSSRIVLRCVCY